EVHAAAAAQRGQADLGHHLEQVLSKLVNTLAHTGGHECASHVDTLPSRLLEGRPGRLVGESNFTAEIVGIIIVTDRGLSIANSGGLRKRGKLRPDRRD